MEFLKNSILELGSFIALFAIIEQILKLDMRKALGRYIFAQRGAGFPEFELNTINALMGPFIVSDRLQWRRVLLLSLTVSLVTILFLQFSFVSGKPGPTDRMWLNIASVIPTALIAWPCDWWSLRVTKYFFVDRSPLLPRSLLSFLADIIISVLPLIALLCVVVVFAIAINSSPGAVEAQLGEPGNVFFFALVISIIANAISSLIISAVQLTVLLLGTIARSFFTVTRLGPILAKHTDVEKYPLSFIGLLLGLIFLIAT
jgi:hypothetical protein